MTDDGSEPILILDPEDAELFFDAPLYLEDEGEASAAGSARPGRRIRVEPVASAFPGELAVRLRHRAWEEYAARVAAAPGSAPAAAPVRRRRSRPSNLRRLAETLLLLGGLAAANVCLSPDDPGFRRLEFNPFFVPVVLIAIRYGTLWGLAAGLLAAAWVAGAAGALNLEDGSLALPGLFVVVGTMGGILSQGQGGRLAFYRARAERLARERARLSRALQAKTAVIAELQAKIEEHAIPLETLYAMSRGMGSDEPAEMYRALLRLVARDLKAERCAVYELEGGRLSLRASFDPRPAAAPFPPVLPTDRGLPGLALRLGRVVSALDKEAEETGAPGFLCGPVREGTETRAVVWVEEIPLFDFTPAVVARFAGLLTWAAESRARALAAADGGAEETGEETGLRGPDFLSEALARETSRARRHGTPVRLLLARLRGVDALAPERRAEARRAVARALYAFTREADTVCRTSREDTFAVILPMFESVDPSTVGGRITAALERAWAGGRLELTFGFAEIDAVPFAAEDACSRSET